MADVSNLNIMERSNVERPILRESLKYQKINKQQSYKINLYQSTNMRIVQFSSDTKYRIDEQFRNLTISRDVDNFF